MEQRIVTISSWGISSSMPVILVASSRSTSCGVQVHTAFGARAAGWRVRELVPVHLHLDVEQLAQSLRAAGRGHAIQPLDDALLVERWREAVRLLYEGAAARLRRRWTGQEGAVQSG